MCLVWWVAKKWIHVSEIHNVYWGEDPAAACLVAAHLRHLHASRAGVELQTAETYRTGVEHSASCGNRLSEDDDGNCVWIPITTS